LVGHGDSLTVTYTVKGEITALRSFVK